jgi:adenylate cyclase
MGLPMPKEGFNRKLTAILSADAVGYSRLMADDEEATISTLTAYRSAITDLVEQYRGRVIDSPGDNILAEFNSVVDAVNCAVEIQRELAERNDNLPVKRKMPFRIGVNLGDVVQEGERIYGDGVNIAARIEGLADSGGVSISGTAFDSVRNKLDYGYRFSGEHTVKNIADPVRIYKVLTAPEHAGKVIGEKRFVGRISRKAALMVILALAIVAVGSISYFIYLHRAGRIEPASVEKMALPLPKKPSIAVLPFTNIGGDQNQDYLSDGFTENIITALSKIPEMFVIARNSVFSYKGNPVKIQKVAEDLGVQYILEGSVQKAGNRVRVTGQLIDAIKGHHLWAEQYDREIEDLFSVQDEITLAIVSSLQVKLTDGEQARLRDRSTNNLEAWGLAVRGYSYWHRYTEEDNAKALELFQRAIEIDPEYAWAWTMLGFTYFIDTRYGWHRSRDESFKKMVEHAQKSVLLDDSDPDAHALLAQTHLLKKEFEKAINEGEKSLSLGPNSAENHAIVGMIYRFAGRFEDSIRMTEKAIRLHPYYPDWYLYSLEYSYYYLGQHEKAIALAKKHIKLIENRGGTDMFWQHLILAQNYIRLGKDKEARYHAAEALRQKPDYTFKWERESSLYKDPALIEQQIEDLRKAGLTCEGE